MGNTLSPDSILQRSVTKRVNESPQRETCNPEDYKIPIQIWEHTVCGMRPDNEDAHCIMPLPKHPDWFCIGVYDGHSGDMAAKYSAEHLHINIDNEMEELENKSGESLTFEDMRYAMIKGIIQTDDGFLATVQESGCTVCVVLLNSVTRMMIAGNLGDARAIMSRANGRTETLTFDHKPTGREEVARIEEAKHTVVDGRLDDILACSRAVGDYRLKIKDYTKLAEKKALCPYPYIRDFYHMTGLNSRCKEVLTNTLEDIQERQKIVRARFKSEQKELFAQYKLDDAKTAKEEEKRKATNAARKQECKALGIPYVGIKRKVHFQTRFRYPTSAFKIRNTSVFDDDDDIEDDMKDPTQKFYQFLVVACDGLYDVMSNLEITNWVNEELRKRARVNRVIVQNANIFCGLDAKGENVVRKKLPNRNAFNLTGEHKRLRQNQKSQDHIMEDPPYRPLDYLASDLCALALKKNSTDNVSVVIVMLEEPPKPVLKHEAMKAARKNRKVLKLKNRQRQHSGLGEGAKAGARRSVATLSRTTSHLLAEIRQLGHANTVADDTVGVM